MNTAMFGRWDSLSTRKAFAIHLTLSLLIFSSLVFVMLMWWFPGELFFLDGGWQGLKIIALIDLVLGPLLTLILYKPKKKSLLLDMSLIAGFQLAALAYGFYATHQQRTVAVVYADRGFMTLSADAAKVAHHELVGKKATPKVIAELDNGKPAMLLTPEPRKGEFGKYMEQLFSGYPEPHERLDLFEKRTAKHAEILTNRAVSEEVLNGSGTNTIVDNAIKAGGFEHVDIEVHRFRARYAKGFVLFSKSQQEILDYIPIDWAELAKLAEAKEAGKEQTENVETKTGETAVPKAVIAESEKQ